MPTEPKTHHRGMEITEVIGRFPDQYVFASILQALRATVVSIRAKQSQFAGGGIDTNCRCGKGLWETDADYASEKTKPIFLSGW